MLGDRSVSDIFQDILSNFQEIVRSEVRLAKTEIREEAVKAKSSAAMLGAGALTAVFAVLYLLLTIVYALATVMPNWAAALIVGGVLAIAAAAILMAGVKRFKQIQPAPHRTVQSIRENVEWARQQIK